MAVVLFVLAACMSTAAAVSLSRANPGVRLTIWGTPPNDPISVKVLRGLAIGLAIFAAISLDGRLGPISWWAVLPILAVLMGPLTLLQLWGRRRESARTGR